MECMECLNEDVKKKDRFCTSWVGTIKLLIITHECYKFSADLIVAIN